MAPRLRQLRRCLTEAFIAGSDRGDRLGVRSPRPSPYRVRGREAAGVILATAHTGGWQVAGPRWSSFIDDEVLVVMRRERDARAQALQDARAIAPACASSTSATIRSTRCRCSPTSAGGVVAHADRPASTRACAAARASSSGRPARARGPAPPRRGERGADRARFHAPPRLHGVRGPLAPRPSASPAAPRRPSSTSARASRARGWSLRARQPHAVVPLRVKSPPHGPPPRRTPRAARRSREVRAPLRHLSSCSRWTPRSRARHAAQVAQSVPPASSSAWCCRAPSASSARAGELDEALATALEVAAAVEARCVVLQTPASAPHGGQQEAPRRHLRAHPARGLCAAGSPRALGARRGARDGARARRAPGARRRARGAAAGPDRLHAPARARQVGGAGRPPRSSGSPSGCAAGARRSWWSRAARGAAREDGARGRAGPKRRRAPAGVPWCAPAMLALIAEDEEQ